MVFMCNWNKWKDRMLFFFFKQKTAYEIVMCWSSDVCSSDLDHRHLLGLAQRERLGEQPPRDVAFSSREQGEVACGDGHETDVVDDRKKAKHRGRDSQRDQRRPDRHRPDEPGLRREAAGEVEGPRQRGGTTLPATASSTLSGV